VQHSTHSVREARGAYRYLIGRNAADASYPFATVAQSRVELPQIAPPAGSAQQIEDYTKAIETDPQFAIGYLNRGAAFCRQGQYDEALKDLDRGIEPDRGNADAYLFRGSILSNAGEYERALPEAK
jgi:tetratricopeptide (TPR) repeat protein